MKKPKRMLATVNLPTATCAGCGEEHFVLDGQVVEHGDINGMCIDGKRVEFSK